MNEPIVLTIAEQARSSREEDPRLSTEDRVAAVGLVALTALPAMLVATPAAVAIWLVCGRWTRGYHLARTALRTPLELAKDAVLRNTDNLTPEERQQLEGLLRKV